MTTNVRMKDSHISIRSLEDVDLKEIQIINFVRRLGQIIVCPKSKYANLLNSEFKDQLKSPGVYMLISRFNKQLYIGKTETLDERLRRHKRDKIFWDECFIFSAPTNNITSTHITLLEHLLITKAKETGNYEMGENSNTPRKNHTTSMDDDVVDGCYEVITEFDITFNHYMFSKSLISVSDDVVINTTIIHSKLYDYWDDFFQYAKVEHPNAGYMNRAAQDKTWIKLTIPKKPYKIQLNYIPSLRKIRCGILTKDADDGNKIIYNMYYANKDQIENITGPLIWSRSDGNKESHIDFVADYVDDATSYQWMVDKIILLKTAFV